MQKLSSFSTQQDARADTGRQAFAQRVPARAANLVRTQGIGQGSAEMSRSLKCNARGH